MAKASPTQAWLWHQILLNLNFDYINLLSKKDIMISLPKLKYVKDQLCSSCEVSKAKRSSFKSKAVPSIEFLNKTLNAFFKEEENEHQTSTARTPEQNDDVKRRNRTLVEDAQTMLSALKLPLFFWAEAIAIAYYTKNQSIIISTHDKTAYHIINDRKPSIKHLYIFCCIFYLIRDGENLDKMKEKGDPSILASDYDNSDSVPQLHNVSSLADAHVPSQQELDLLFGPLYNEFFTAVSLSVNKSSCPINNSNQQGTQPTTNIQSTPAPSTPTYVHAEENNNNQAEEEHLQDDEFSNPFFIQVQEVNESSSYNIEQVHGNPSKPVQTRRQLATDLEMCMFALTMSTAAPKNIKEAMADSAWIEAMQEELYQFDRL
uniref:GAG-pre-integrase domain-containing protein n=1 Tax=Tanacetum cinerariifolium TaxID=118510 RepID=A0A6L2N4R1_TANCI|nr:hypothetical protein [Tanacetum cinerariifolium]